VRGRRKPRDLRRFDIKLWVPPDYAVDLAQDRTEGMLSCYMLECWGDVEMLKMLVRSAYLQGVNDTIDAAVKQGLLKEPEEAVG